MRVSVARTRLKRFSSSSSRRSSSCLKRRSAKQPALLLVGDAEIAVLDAVDQELEHADAALRIAARRADVRGEQLGLARSPDLEGALSEQREAVLDPLGQLEQRAPALLAGQRGADQAAQPIGLVRLGEVNEQPAVQRRPQLIGRAPRRLHDDLEPLGSRQRLEPAQELDRLGVLALPVENDGVEVVGSAGRERASRSRRARPRCSAPRAGCSRLP